MSGIGEDGKVAPPSNLPVETTSFVGRGPEIAQIRTLVTDQRLVTLVGAGGVGKTRTALHCAASLLDNFPGGVWFVELAALNDPALVASAIATAVNVRQSAQRPVADSLVEYLKDRQALIVLDNCEHVIRQAARTTELILRKCAEVHVLATSREKLSLIGERVYRLPSLDPSASVELFVERARAVDPGFAAAADVKDTVREICARLDGIALAIELAAAQAKEKAIADIAAGLGERFNALTPGERASIPRQQTMRALIDWSYDLISDAERRLFRRVSVLAGTWSVAAAKAVASDEELDESSVPELIVSLVEKSLVVRDGSGGEPRYRLLEPIREYAKERLIKSGEHDDIARKHAAWIAKLVERLDEGHGTIPYSEWLAAFRPEVDNVRSALTWAFGATGDFSLAADIAAKSYGLWREAGLSHDGKHWVELALDYFEDTAATETVARLYFARAALSGAQEAVDASQRAISIFEQLDMRLELARCHAGLAFFLVQVASPQEALGASDAAIALYRELGLTNGQRFASALNVRATILCFLDRFDEARSVFAESIALYNALDDQAGAARPRFNLAELLFRSGDVTGALGLAERVADAARKSGDAVTEAAALCSIAAYRLILGLTGAARTAAADALPRTRSLQWAQGSLAAIGHLATIAALDGRAHLAAKLLGFVDRAYLAEGLEREPPEQRGYEMLVDSLNAQLPESEIAVLEAEGAMWTIDRAADEAAAFDSTTV